MTNAMPPDAIGQALVDAYTGSYRLLARRSRDGDPVADLNLVAIEQASYIPARATTRDWLESVARERRMFVPTADARDARTLLDARDRAEAAARPYPGAADATWTWMVKTARERLTASGAMTLIHQREADQLGLGDIVRR